MKPKITVVSLGPGDPGLLTLQTADHLRSGKTRLILRTSRHPAARWLAEQNIAMESMDSWYDRYDDFDEMHRAMAEWLWAEAVQKAITLGVADAGTDGLVLALGAARPEKAELRVLPGVSASENCIASLPPECRPDPGLQAFSAFGFLSLTDNPECSLLLTELDSALLAGEVKLRLADLLEDEQEILFFPPSEQTPRPVRKIALYQLDTQKAYDHTAAVFIPGLGYLKRERHTFGDLTRIVSRLRAPDGCPWDRIQTHESLRPYMVEEAWEAVNAIDDGDMDHLADELGDVLFQVFIHASIGESCGEFSMTDVVSGICRKMIQRHPHVFVRSGGETATEIAQGWEARKREETGSRTVGETLNDVSSSLPALKYSIKMYKKLAQLPALRRDPETVCGEIRAAADSLMKDGRFSPEAMAVLLRKCTELCYREDQDAEILLHGSTVRMKNMYQAAEKKMLQDKKSPESLTFQQLCVYLDSVEEDKDSDCP